MARRVVQNHTREIIISKEIKPVNREIVNQKVIVNNLKRELPKIPSFSSNALLSQIRGFTALKNFDYYLGFGGLGDALLLLANCWNNPKAKVVFFSNYQPFTREFFNLFKIPVFLHDNIMGTNIASHIYDYMIKLPTFKTSAHLADSLDYNDWRNENKYLNRMPNHVPWINKIGKVHSEKPILILAPSGSHRDSSRQRYMTPEEYGKVAQKYLNQGYKVYGTGSISDLHFFGLINHENFYWLNSNSIYNYRGEKSSSDLTHMLKTINSATLVISVDTWLKTYTLLCNIQTFILQTRWNNTYKFYGEDVTDLIFLNPKIWTNITTLKIEELL